jgi:hypothetical protein
MCMFADRCLCMCLYMYIYVCVCLHYTWALFVSGYVGMSINRGSNRWGLKKSAGRSGGAFSNQAATWFSARRRSYGDGEAEVRFTRTEIGLCIYDIWFIYDSYMNHIWFIYVHRSYVITPCDVLSRHVTSCYLLLLRVMLCLHTNTC